MKIAVFTDFDGTISKYDVGYSLFHHFSGGRNDALLPDWKEGRITSREVLTLEAEMVTATKDELYEYIDKIEIDDSFPEFVRLIERQDIPLTVVSDGLDFYIKHLLDKNELGYLKVISNQVVFDGDKLGINFPVDNTNCRRCGICKGEVIERFKEENGDDCKIIFIGDGYSDTCAALKADVLFAKKDLEEYCQREKIDYYSYHRFTDVILKLNELGLLNRLE